MQSKMNQCSNGVAEEKDKLKVGLEGEHCVFGLCENEIPG